MTQPEAQTQPKPSKYEPMARMIVGRAVICRGQLETLIGERTIFGDGIVHPIEPEISAGIWQDYLSLSREEKAAGRKHTASTAAVAIIVERTIELLEQAEPAK